MDLQKSIKRLMRWPSVRPPITLIKTLMVVLLLVFSVSSWITYGLGMEYNRDLYAPYDMSILNITESSVIFKVPESQVTTRRDEFYFKCYYFSYLDLDHTYLRNNCKPSSDKNISFPKSECWELEAGYYYLYVNGLPDPDYVYQFGIIVPRGANNSWSLPGLMQFRTKSTVPKRPPQMDIGSFFSILQIDDESKRDVYVYWRPINEREKCGDEFRYFVYYTQVTGIKTMIYPSDETGNNYAKFVGLHTAIGYNITVFSSNKEGLSTEFSTVYVPSESKIIEYDRPLSLTKMMLSESGGFVELTWNHDDSHKLFGPKLNDYTLFWCEKLIDHPFQCNAYMNWTHISKSLTSYNMTLLNSRNDYLFGISANMHIDIKTHNNSQFTPISSGMVWQTCTLLQDKLPGKLENVRVGYISTTFVELRWTVDCSSKMGTISGYRIYHCPVVSINNATCLEPMKNKEISGTIVHQSRNFASFRNLMPYTSYKFAVALITTRGEGLISDPIVRTTLEGPPDVSNLSISVTGITNISVDISWLPPKYTNGVVRYYRVHYWLCDVMEQETPRDLIDIKEDDKLMKLTGERNFTVQDTKCRLENLQSYRYYKITISACTTKCSQRAFPIQVLTGVGFPGRISKPTVLFKNMTGIVISWHRPMNPHGLIDYYQVIILNHNGPFTSTTMYDGSMLPTELVDTLTHENPDNLLYQINTNVFRVPVPECTPRDKLQKFYYAVRAVNKNPLDPQKPFYGPWSVPGSVKCSRKNIIQ